jgi:hypothetical protein
MKVAAVDEGRHWSADAAVAVEVDSNVALEPSDHFTEQLLCPKELGLESGDAMLEHARSLAVLGDLALLIEVPEKSHMVLVAGERGSAFVTDK